MKLELLLEELNLGSSDVADKETALKLGKVLAAKLLGTGSLFYLPNGTQLLLKLMDSETSVVPKVFTKQFSSGIPNPKELHQLNRDILRAIMLKYPLRGFVAEVTGDEVMINLGSKQGVVQGTKFEVLEEQKPRKYKGKVIQRDPKTIAEIEIAEVESEVCFARVLRVRKRTMSCRYQYRQVVYRR